MKRKPVQNETPAKRLMPGKRVEESHELRDYGSVRDSPPQPAVLPASAQCEAGMAKRVRVEIEAASLLQLLKGRRLCATDMRCLDCQSKRCLLRLLLKACADDLAESRLMERSHLPG